jgi:hypothetical protein
MDPDLRRRMLAYYNERAPEYEQAYTLGTGTASIRDTEIFKTEARVLAGVIARTERAAESWIWRAARRTGCRITLRPVLE